MCVLDEPAVAYISKRVSLGSGRGEASGINWFDWLKGLLAVVTVFVKIKYTYAYLKVILFICFPRYFATDIWLRVRLGLSYTTTN